MAGGVSELDASEIFTTMIPKPSAPSANTAPKIEDDVISSPRPEHSRPARWQQDGESSSDLTKQRPNVVEPLRRGMANSEGEIAISREQAFQSQGIKSQGTKPQISTPQDSKPQGSNGARVQNAHAHSARAHSSHAHSSHAHSSHAHKSHWQMRLLPDSLDRIGEPPRLNWQTTPDHDAGEIAPAQDILLSHTVVEDDREPLYHLDLLRLFRQRIRLVSLLGLILVPFFHLFYSWTSPETARQVLMPHALMLALCLVYSVLATRIANLVWARLLTVVGYVIVCTGASLVLAILAQNQFDDAASRNIQFAVLAAHSQILLSVVLLPLSVWESLVMGVVVAASLIWSAWWTLPFESSSMHSAQIFVLLTTAAFVLCVAYFQSALRRRVFDSSFDLARSAAQLQTLSILDAVTGGFNRLYLEKTLSLEINRAARFSHPLSVMMFDLDNFKIVNDTQGHTVGDEVLRAVAEAARAAVRDVDTVARYGGDEFVIVLPETEQDDARAVAERLQTLAHEQLRERFEPNSPQIAVTLSIGLVTLHLTEPMSLDTVISLADVRLYEAKRMGKNRIAM